MEWCWTVNPAVQVSAGEEALDLCGHGLQQSLLLLGAAGRLQLVHSGQVEEYALVEVEGGVLLHQALQLAQGLLQTAQVEQAHRCIVVGLGTREGREGMGEDGRV
ncbi:hypothetical protein F7725_007798 [Dissostichus mawsoni]|uniref:Uncharacterized protein n=1 Tax=Dissostichus mawsoni TaxID=36200 RepID=A0A7J5Y5D2_DISMA|nr:hypothetical protein F7725_007798 [Dissostichus mawsoni]